MDKPNMAEVTHKYYCSHCRQYVFGSTPALLAREVNTHNTAIHPADYADWSAEGIMRSSWYSGPPVGPLVQYTNPFGTTSRREWGDAKSAPNITDQDRAMLAQGLVKW
jgi:hypothetical protein